MRLDRRAVVGGALALSACSRGEGAAQASAPLGEDPTYPTAAGHAAAAPPVGAAEVPALRRLAPFPVGTALLTTQLDEPAAAALAAKQFSQITAGFEMKMEVTVKDDGGLDFTRGDRIAAYARQNGQRLHGHTLIWYAEEPKAFKALDGKPDFAAAHDRYIQAVMARWPAASWDVVNEPIMEQGEGLRECLWSRNLGAEAYIDRAFRIARAADPKPVLFMNEYFLETKPKKRATFMALIERLLKRGVPIGGIGNQSHLSIDVAPGLAKAAMKDLASLGLPIHVSELDCSTYGHGLDLRSREDKLKAEARVYGEVMEAFMALPERQRFAFTLWQPRDKDSWLRSAPGGHPDDSPAAFDDDGRPKPAFYALTNALKRRA